MGFFPASATAQSGSRVETSRAETQPIDRTDNKTEPVGKSRENTALRHSSQFQCQKWKKNKKNKRAGEEEGEGGGGGGEGGTCCQSLWQKS